VAMFETDAEAMWGLTREFEFEYGKRKKRRGVPWGQEESCCRGGGLGFVGGGFGEGKFYS